MKFLMKHEKTTESYVTAMKIKSLKANKVKKNAKKATVTLKFKKVKGIKKYE